MGDDIVEGDFLFDAKREGELAVYLARRGAE